MKILRRAYDWTLSLAGRPMAEFWLMFIAFIESSVFLVPADILFVAMALAKPRKAYRFALLATLASTAGGVAGYLIGAYFFTEFALPVLQFYHKDAMFEALKACGGRDGVMLLLVTSGLTPLPPIQVVTILAGVLQVGLGFFIIACLLARGTRFFLLAWALRRWGEPIRHFIEKWLTWIAFGFVLALGLIYLILKSNVGSLSAC